MKKLIILVVFLLSVAGCVTIKLHPQMSERCVITLDDKEVSHADSNL